MQYSEEKSSKQRRRLVEVPIDDRELRLFMSPRLLLGRVICWFEGYVFWSLYIVSFCCLIWFRYHIFICSFFNCCVVCNSNWTNIIQAIVLITVKCFDWSLVQIYWLLLQESFHILDELNKSIIEQSSVEEGYGTSKVGGKLRNIVILFVYIY